MLKAMSRLWLRSLARAGRAQQIQASKLLKSLLTKPKAKAQAKPKTKIKAKPKSSAILRKRPKIAKSARATAALRNLDADAISSLPSGIWLTSFYSSLADSAILPVRRMTYCLYLPDQYSAHAARLNQNNHENKTLRPLIVMLHGCEQSATEFALGSRMNQLAGKKGVAVLYPQQALRAHPNRCWKWYDAATQEGGGDVQMIIGMIKKITQKYPIDTTRIYLCGISAGAAMADIVALNHPDLFAAIGLHSGPMFGAGHSKIGAYGVMQHGASHRVGAAITEVLHRTPAFPSMPTLLIQGMSDTIVRPINQSQLIQQTFLLNRLTADSARAVARQPASAAGSLKAANAYEVHDFYLGKKLLLRSTQIASLGHAWSGGNASLPFNSASGPDASKMMLDFFSLHSRINTLNT
ncbi:alpha/beta hydrolase family esterase [Undibacterium sp. Ren11W]